MPQADLHFTADLEGLAFPDGESVEVRTDSVLGKVDITFQSASAGILQVTVRLLDQLDIPDVDTLIPTVTEIAEVAIDGLAFHTEVGIGPARFEKAHFPLKLKLSFEASEVRARPVGNQLVVRAHDLGGASHTGFIGGSLTRVLVFGTGNGHLIAEKVGSGSPPESFLVAFFRDAIRARDIRVRFVLLYSLLAMVHGPRQESIDAWILNRLPDIPTSPRLTRKSGELREHPTQRETAVSRVRNEIAHAGERRKNPEEVLRSTSRVYKTIVQLAKITIVEADATLLD